MFNKLALVLRAVLLLHLLMSGTDAKMDIISSKPDFEVGEEILLLCKAGGEGEITWQKDGNDLDDEEIVQKVDETSSKVVIKKATIEDAGKYTCKCEFDSGHQDDTFTHVFVYEGPSFFGTTTYHEFLEGTNGTVACVVTGKPAVEVKWYRNNEEILYTGMRVHTMSDNRLRIGKVTRKDAGTYVCQALIKGRPVHKELPVSVVVNVPPTVHLKEEVKKVIAGPQTNVTLLCLVDGIPKPNITWTMPVDIDPSHHQFNSDRSQLTIQSVVRDDYGEYVCTAKNKIAEDTATIMLHVFVAPEVTVSEEEHRVQVGERVLVACNVSGHPQPELHWLNKQNGFKLDSSSGRVQVVDGVLEIDEIVPSDGGLYSCMAVSPTRNASRDVAIYTQPGPPHYLTVSPGPASVLFSLRSLPISGGMPITNFSLQWKEKDADEWNETIVQVSEPLAITSLRPYTTYAVRLAALNAVGRGQFSDPKIVHTRGIDGEPEKPTLSTEEMKVEGNCFSVPLKKNDEGGSPMLHFGVRFRQDAEESEWKEMQLNSEADSVDLKDLSFGSDYQLEVVAVNANGSSIPATFNFTIAELPVSKSMTKGTVVGIVMLIFLLVFLVVDATCCYRNRCGLLMTIAVKLFGKKVPGLKMMEEGDGSPEGEVKLKGISTPRRSLQQSGVQTVSKEPGQLSEVTCDKAPLTKNEKMHIPLADA